MEPLQITTSAPYQPPAPPSPSEEASLAIVRTWVRGFLIAGAVGCVVSAGFTTLNEPQWTFTAFALALASIVAGLALMSSYILK
jgi:hypothetical protein